MGRTEKVVHLPGQVKPLFTKLLASMSLFLKTGAVSANLLRDFVSTIMLHSISSIKTLTATAVNGIEKQKTGGYLDLIHRVKQIRPKSLDTQCIKYTSHKILAANCSMYTVQNVYS